FVELGPALGFHLVQDLGDPGVVHLEALRLLYGPLQPAPVAVHGGKGPGRGFGERVRRDAGLLKLRPALGQALAAHEDG
ncbi:hypothetical protein DF186_24285, partial [Enterococcus hirae]